MHFTYAEQPDVTQLKQGDVVAKTDAIAALLDEHYPYWVQNEDYTHLMVLTQTCDLIRRDGKPCRAQHISVAAVKPVEKAICLQVERYQRGDFARHGNVCPLGKRDDFIRFLQRLMNNNEGDYFYLHRDVGAGFPQSSCAFLRISVAFQTQHYDRLCEGKLLELTESFQAKLGWLVGTIYSRVGTGDWVPHGCTAKVFESMLSGIADEACQWLEAPRIKKLSRAWKKDGASPDEAERLVRAEIDAQRPLTRKQRVVESVLEELIAQGIVEQEKATSVRKALYQADEVKNL